MDRPAEVWVLRRLFVQLVLRGSTADGLTRESMPRSMPARVAAEGLFYAMAGLTALLFIPRPIAYLELYLHTGTLVLVGLFLAHAAGDILADRHEALVFSFRPVSLQAVIWAKAMVLAEIAFWLAGAFNLTGLAVGSFAAEGTPFFVLAHVLSTMLNVLFCVGSVLLWHELRIAWRSRRPGVRGGFVVMLLAAVVAFAVIRGVDFQLSVVIDRRGALTFLFPPAWFAGLDEVLLNGARDSRALAGCAVAMTSLVAWLALGPMTRRREHWATVFLGADSTRPRTASTLLRALVHSRVACWGLRTAAARAAFAVTTLYLIRSREVKFRLLSALSPILAMPWLLLLPNHGQMFFTQFWIANMGIYLGVFAFLAVQLIETSSDWRAAEIFLRAPLAGPTELCNGARRAIMVIGVPPLVFFYFAVVWFLGRDAFALTLLVPGILAVPLYAYLPNLLGRGVPFAAAPNSSEAASLLPMLAKWTFRSVPFAGLAALCYGTNYFWLLLVIEVMIVVWVFRKTRRRLEGLRWRSPADGTV